MQSASPVKLKIITSQIIHCHKRKARALINYGNNRQKKSRVGSENRPTMNSRQRLTHRKGKNVKRRNSAVKTRT